MYYESNSARIDEKYQHSKMLKDLADEKDKVDNRYTSMLNDMKNFFEDTHIRVMKENYARIMKGGEEEEQKALDEKMLLKNEVEVLKTKVVLLEKERDVLKSEVGMQKNIQKTQADVLRIRQQEFADERDALKEEKKKVEYSLHDLWKAHNAQKEKLNNIKAICDE